MKIIKIHLEHLRAENHYEFMTLFRLLLDKFDAVKALIIALYANFIALLADEGLLVDAMKITLNISYTETRRPCRDVARRVSTTAEHCNRTNPNQGSKPC